MKSIKQKSIFTLTLALLAFGLFGSNPQQPKNYYQFGLGIWVFEPLHSQVFAMSYERSINSKFAIGGAFTFQIEEYSPGDHFQTNAPNHDFIYGKGFSHPQLLSENTTTPGLVYFNGSTWREEETFGGIYLSYTLFSNSRSFADIALGGGAMINNFQVITEERFDYIRIDTDTVFGKSRIHYYQRDISLAGFFRARYSYQYTENIYLGSSLVLPYVYSSGFPLKLTLNVGVRF